MYIDKDSPRQVRTEPSVSARIDRLPSTRYLRGLVSRIAIGGWFEFYELFMAAYISLGLVQSGMYRSTTQGLFDINGFASFLGSFFAGMFVGAVVLSQLADKLGRRTVFTSAMALYSLATLVAAFQTTPLSMDAWRFVAGIGIGVQLITVGTYISELMPNHIRGRAIAFGILVILTAVPSVAVISYLLVPHTFLGLEGWRWVMIIGSSGGAFLWLLRRGLPESPRWLENRGRTEEARRVVDEMERRVQREIGRPLPSIDPTHESIFSGPIHGNGTWIEMWRGPYRKRTIMLSIFHFFQTFGVYGFGSWVPVLLFAKGMTITHSLLYTMVIAFATPLGALGAMMFSERFERKWQLVGCAITIALAGLSFGAAREPTLILVFGSIVTIANNWMIGIFQAYQAELYPTRIRARSVGFVYSWSRFSSIFLGFWVAALLKSSGVEAVFALISGAMLMIVVVVSWLGPKTNGIALEEISR